MARLAATSDAVIYLPGIMGSELVNASGDVVWGLKPSLVFRQAAFGNILDRLALRPGDGISASRPLRFPAALPMLSSMEPYAALEERLKTVVVAPEAVRPFAYDWRKSIADAAEKLGPVAREHLAQWRSRWNTLPAEDKRGLPEPGLTLVAHSMGGLVASYFAAFVDGGELVRRVITLGTPFNGSLNAVDALATGKQFPFGAFAESLRAAVRMLPGVYELVARWECVTDGESRRRLTPDDLEDIGADRELAEAAMATIGKMRSAFGDDSTRKPPVRCLVGTTQATRQTVRIRDGVPEFFEHIDGRDRRGDGTVFLDAARPPNLVPSYVPQAHGALGKAHEAVEFIAAVLTEEKLDKYQAPSGIGLRVPEIVTVNQTFVVEILDGNAGLMCQLIDAEDNRLITVTPSKVRDGSVQAEFKAPKPGLFRVAVSGGGFSPVEALVGAMTTT